jgi:hypothetical protein
MRNPKSKLMNLKVPKNAIYQIGFTVFTGIMTIIIPLVNYLNFKDLVTSIKCYECTDVLAGRISLGNLEAIYDTLIYLFVILGFVISVCAYLTFKYQRYSVQRGSLTLLVSIMYLISTIGSSQMNTVLIEVAKIQIIMDFSGVYILFMVIMSLYILKNLYDVIDFKINKSYYISSQRQNRYRRKVRDAKLIPCPQCNYTCRYAWKKCPICNTKILKTR